MKNVKMKKKTEEKYLRICPKCGSANVTLDSSNIGGWALGTFSSVKYICKKCGFNNVVYPEIEFDKVEDFRKKIKKHKK